MVPDAFGPGYSPFRAVGGRGGGGCGLSTKSRVQYTHAPGLPRFILLVSFSNTLLVVSTLDIVYECHLWLLL